MLRGRFPHAAAYNLGISDVGSDQYRLAVEYAPAIASWLAEDDFPGVRRAFP